MGLLRPPGPLFNFFRCRPGIQLETKVVRLKKSFTEKWVNCMTLKLSDQNHTFYLFFSEGGFWSQSHIHRYLAPPYPPSGKQLLDVFLFLFSPFIWSRVCRLRLMATVDHPHPSSILLHDFFFQRQCGLGPHLKLWWSINFCHSFHRPPHRHKEMSHSIYMLLGRGLILPYPPP